MAHSTTALNVAVIEAEEELLIEWQSLVQELMVDKGLTQTEVATRAGFSKARLSQLLGSEANPTLKNCARLFLALGERLCLGVKETAASACVPPTAMISAADFGEWTLDVEDVPATRRAGGERDAQTVAALKEKFASNDNYRNVEELETQVA